ncbi:MAG TPA: hypothetical protein VNO21_13540, partial [Polyangiaceae bacterium]|nr:hypothetical protein [Polyangiaceae bacterium]
MDPHDALVPGQSKEALVNAVAAPVESRLPQSRRPPVESRLRQSRRPPVITAWSAVSPFGIGRDALVNGLRLGQKRIERLDPAVWPAPIEEACLVPDFNPRALLGQRGTRAMDRATALAVVATGRLLDDGAGGRLPGIGEDAALVLGTSMGSVSSIMSFTS